MYFCTAQIHIDIFQSLIGFYGFSDHWGVEGLKYEVFKVQLYLNAIYHLSDRPVNRKIQISLKLSDVFVQALHHSRMIVHSLGDPRVF